jgi:hypothetical protein
MLFYAVFPNMNVRNLNIKRKVISHEGNILSETELQGKTVLAFSGTLTKIVHSFDGNGKRNGPFGHDAYPTNKIGNICQKEAILMSILSLTG